MFLVYNMQSATIRRGQKGNSRVVCMPAFILGCGYATIKTTSKLN